MVTAHEKADMTKYCTAMAVAVRKSRTTHPDVEPTNTQCSEAAVEAATSTLGSWLNPFGLTDDLVNVSSGLVVPEDIATDLISAEKNW